MVMNLAVLKRQRRKAAAGDVFAMRPPDGRYLFGRVISTTAQVGPMVNNNLIYVYRTRSDQKVAPLTLHPAELLLSPMITNDLPWTKGYFEFLENRPLQDADVLPTHCFKDTVGRYFDDMSRQLPGPVEPVGRRGLHSFRTIDDEISRALGIALAPP